MTVGVLKNVIGTDTGGELYRRCVKKSIMFKYEPYEKECRYS